MKAYTSLLASFFLVVYHGVEGFSAPCTTASKRRISFSTRNAILIRGMDDESTYRYLLAKARECAFSDFATVQEAKRYLTQILELESGCVSGNLSGRDICDNVDELADIVAHLRQKADQNEAVSSRDISAGVSIGALVLISLIFAGVAEYQWQQDVTPFTAEEWTYAARGGYLNTMIAHYIRNGGL